MTRLDKSISVLIVAEMCAGATIADVMQRFDCTSIQVRKLRNRVRGRARALGQPDPFPSLTIVATATRRPIHYAPKVKAMDDALFVCPPTAPHKAWFPPRPWNAPVTNTPYADPDVA